MASKKTYTRDQLSEKTVAELRQMCISNGIAGMSKKRKDEVVEALIYYYDGPKGKKIEKTNDGPLKNLTTEFNKIETGKHLVRVSCGAASGNFPVVGKSVGAVAEYLKEVLNVDRLSTGVVNGDDVKDSYVLKSGDSLEFIKTAGRKG